VTLMCLGKPQDTTLKCEPCVGFSDWKTHLALVQSSLRSFSLAYLSIYIIHGGEDGYQYAAYGKAATWDFAWMWPILLRNIIGTYLICALWDWFMYFSPLAPHFKPFKIVEEYPSLK